MLTALTGEYGSQGIHCILKVLHVSTANDVDIRARGADVHLDFLVVEDSVTKHFSELLSCLSCVLVIFDI